MAVKSSKSQRHPKASPPVSDPVVQEAATFQELSEGIAEYTAKNIQTLKDLAAVRNRPTEFFPDTEIMGMRHAGKEILDNGLDEISLLGDHAWMSATIVRDLKTMSYVMIIEDSGRGIPLEPNDEGTPVYIAVATELHTSGKYDDSAYATSSGSFGLGMKGTAGTSSQFRQITRRPNGTGSLLVCEGAFDKKPNIKWQPNATTGTTVVYRPDPKIFSRIDDFTESGYGLLIDLFRQYVFFRYYNLQFKEISMAFPDEFWTASIPKAEAILADIQKRANVVFDSRNVDPDEWIRKQWGLTRNFTWKTAFRKTVDVNVGKLRDWIVKLFYVRGDRQGASFGLVNNVPISGLGNDHLAAPYYVVRKRISALITDPSVRRFYDDNYKLPLFIAADVKYRGARFGGTTKDTFRSSEFRKVFEMDLEHWADLPEGKATIAEFYALIRDDIQARYDESLSIKVVQKDRGRLASRLKRPDKYDDIGEVTRDAELFLVEGDSAKPRRLPNQAVYRMGGKPFNLVKVADGKTKSQLIDMAMKIPIYHDILTLIGFDCRNPNMDTLNFASCNVLSDADSHGRHIAAIVIGSLHLVAPMLVDSGFFGIVAPPYYEIKSSRDQRKSMFVRDQEDIVQWDSQVLFEPYFNIKIAALDTRVPPKQLTGRQYSSFAEIVNKVGIALDNLSEEMSIHPLILEGLTLCTGYLSPLTMDPEVIKRTLGCDRVTYFKDTHTLAITADGSDEIVPLHLVPERIINEILPVLRMIRWNVWIPLVTTIKTTEWVDQPLSIYQLYLVFQKVKASLTTVKPIKGIGSMNDEESFRTCVDPRYRKIYTITEAGDTGVISALLGSGSDARKQLKETAHVSDAMFM